MSEEGGPVPEGLRTLMDDFCGGFNVALTLYSAEGSLLLNSPRRYPLPFCRKVGGWLYGPGSCLAQGRRMRHIAADRRESLVYSCHAGLRCCAFPICRGGRVLAVATIGDFRYGEEPGEAALRDWLRDVGPAARLLDDFSAVPRMSAEAERQMTRLFGIVAGHAVSSGLIASGRSPLFERIVDYVRSHVAEPSIMLDEVASYVSKSASTVSHIVKKEAGMSFKRLVIEQKLEAAESLMTAGSSPSIGEVAERIGYSDQFYFSRVYKKYRGFPPKEFARRSVG
jgi:AraC-like DNA-binding protein